MPGPLSPEGRRKALMVVWTAVVVLGVGVLFRTVRLAQQIGRASTFDRVKSLLVRRLSIEPASITLDANLTDGLRPNGVDRNELAQALQEEFEINIPDEEGAAWITVRDTVASVDRHQQEATRLAPR